MGLLVDENTAVDVLTDPRNHMLNYLHHDVYSTDSVNLTLPQRVQQYVLGRANVFFTWMMADGDLQAQRIDPMAFMTQSLFKFWQLVHGSDRPPEALGKLSLADVIPLEHVMVDRVFRPVKRDYRALMEPYQGDYHIIKETEAVADLEQKLIVLPSSDIIQRYIPEDSDASLLQCYLQTRLQRQALGHLPILLRFYNWTHDTLKGLVPDSIRRKPFFEVLQQLRGHLSPAVIANGKQIFRDLLDVWPLIRERIPSSREDGIVVDLKFDTPFEQLVSTQCEGADQIFCMAQELERLHNKLISPELRTANEAEPSITNEHELSELQQPISYQLLVSNVVQQKMDLFWLLISDHHDSVAPYVAMHFHNDGERPCVNVEAMQQEVLSLFVISI